MKCQRVECGAELPDEPGPDEGVLTQHYETFAIESRICPRCVRMVALGLGGFLAEVRPAKGGPRME